MRSRAFRAAFLVFLSAAFINGCGSAGSGGPTYTIATATQRSDFMDLARADAVLNGRPNSDGTACLWLGERPDGQALSWPYGYSARGDPLSVYDDAGNRVATVGQRVTLAGGLMGDSVTSITGCSGFTFFWGVGEVVSAT